MKILQLNFFVLCSLMAFKPIREQIIRIFTKNEYGAETFEYNSINTQSKRECGIPDIIIENKNIIILVEVKTSLYTGLTSNQPENYLSYLKKYEAKNKYFVALIPKKYQHIQKIKDSLSDENNITISSHIVTWESLASSLEKSELSKMNQYVYDFCHHIKKKYLFKKIQLSYKECSFMYEKSTATGLKKVLNIVDKLMIIIQDKGYSIEKECNNKWWDNGAYGFFINSKDDNYLLWVGVWFDYWENSGIPLCYGIQERWEDDKADIVANFKKMGGKEYVIFPPQGRKEDQYIIKNIDKDTLRAEDSIKEIFQMVEGYLNNYC